MCSCYCDSLLCPRWCYGAYPQKSRQAPQTSLWLWGAEHDPLRSQRLCAQVPSENPSAQPRGGGRGHWLPTARYKTKHAFILKCVFLIINLLKNYFKVIEGLYERSANNALGLLMYLAGYQRQLTYKRQDGSYSAFGERDSSGSMW